MDTALIRQRFSAASASYDAEAEAQQHIAARLWALAAPHVPSGADVLEIGAGTGLLTRLILEAQPRSLTVNDLYLSPQVQELVGQWHAYINRFYDCSPEILLGLGNAYVQHPDFHANYRKMHPAMPEFLTEAIRIYCAARGVTGE